MTQQHQSLTLENGIAVIHANKLENLIGVVQEWLSKYPLPPLENEVFLVNNNGMGQWLKHQFRAVEAGYKTRDGVSDQQRFFLPMAFHELLGRQATQKGQSLFDVHSGSSRGPCQK